MTDQKPPQKTAGKPPAATAATPAKQGAPQSAPQKTPEEEAAGRISSLQEEIGNVEKELKTLEGRLSNCDPAAFEGVKADNDALSARISLLEKALYALLLDSFKPRLNDDVKLQYETLRQAAVEFCQKANIDPEIWKSIAS